jgi:asparagine N-glycosylation enzyme membrane subunit Stt3
MEYIVETGGLPDRDMFMLAPVGMPLQRFNVYQFLGAYSYLFINSLFSMELWQWLVWLPALLASIVAIPSYYAGKLLYDKKAGLFAAFFMVFATSNVSRSLGGDADSDAIVILMPMLVLAAYLLSYKIANKIGPTTKKAVLYSIVAGFMMAVFKYTWSGYWYIFWVIFGFVIIKSVVDVVLNYKKSPTYMWKKVQPTIINFVIFTLVFLVLLIPLGVSAIATVFTEPFDAAGVFSESGGIKGETWEHPNVYVSVQELMSGGQFRDLVDKTAGIPVSGSWKVILAPFLIAFYVFVYFLYSFWRRREHLDSFILLVIWFVGAMYASTVAVRFTMFLIPVLALTSGIAFSRVWKMVLTLGDKKGDAV